MKFKPFKILALLSVLVLVGAACPSETDTTPDTTTSPVPASGFEGTVDEMIVVDQDSANQVTYDGTRFIPDTITIQAGETVTWLNESTSSMWIASDPHPFHTSLLGFDARRATPQGNTYSFTFDNPGTRGYHNHLRSTIRATVIVE